MVTITKEMRQCSELHKFETQTDLAIMRAVDRGESKAVFPLDNDDPYFYELCRLYEKAGYKIVPFGIWGGVRQRGYYITW